MDQRLVNMVSPQQLDIGEILTYGIFECRNDALRTYYNADSVLLIWVRPSTGDSVHVVPALVFSLPGTQLIDERIRDFVASDRIIRADISRIMPMFNGYTLRSGITGVSFVPAMFPKLMDQTRDRRRITEVLSVYNIGGEYGVGILLRLSYFKFKVLVPLAWLVLDYVSPFNGSRRKLYDTAVATYINRSASHLAPYFSDCIEVGGIGVKLDTDFTVAGSTRVDDCNSPILGGVVDQNFSTLTGINTMNVSTVSGAWFRVCESVADVQQVIDSGDNGVQCTPRARQADCIEVDYIESTQLVRVATRPEIDEVELVTIACLVKDDRVYFARLDIGGCAEVDCALFPHMMSSRTRAVLGLGIPVNNNLPGMWGGKMQSTVADMRARYTDFVAPAAVAPASTVSAAWSTGPLIPTLEQQAAAAQARQAAAEQAQQVAAQQAAAAQAQQAAAEQAQQVATQQAAAAAQAQHAAAAQQQAAAPQVYAAAPVYAATAPVYAAHMSHAVPVVQAPTAPASQRPVAATAPAQTGGVPDDDDDNDEAYAKSKHALAVARREEAEAAFAVEKARRERRIAASKGGPAVGPDIHRRVEPSGVNRSQRNLSATGRGRGGGGDEGEEDAEAKAKAAKAKAAKAVKAAKAAEAKAEAATAEAATTAKAATGKKFTSDEFVDSD